MIGTLLERLFVAVGADLSGLTSELDSGAAHVASTTKKIGTDLTKLGSKFQSIGGGMQKAGALMSVGITAPFIALAAQAIPAAEESAKAAGQVQAALTSMGNASGKTMEQLSAAAKELQHLGTFDDDDILAKVTANLLTFGNISGPIFDRTQKAVVDLASRMGTDLQSATVMLGKALNNPAKGLAALQRVGIQFTQQQQDQIKAMQKAGDTAGAQSIMLRELERQFGGSAAAMRAATPGAESIDAWRDFQETIGGVALKVLPVLSSAVADLLNLFNNLSPGMQEVVVIGAAIAAALGPVIMVLGTLMTGIGAILPLLGGAGLAGALGAIGAVALPVLAVVAAMAAAWALWGDKLGPVLEALGTKVQEVLGPKLMALIETVRAGLVSLWEGPLGSAIRTVIGILGELGAAYASVFGEVLVRVISAAVDVISGAFTAIVNVIKMVVAVLTGDWAGAWEAAKALVSGLVTSSLAAFESLVPGVTDAMKRLYEGVRDWIGTRLNMIWEGVKSKIDMVKGWFFGLYDAVVGHSYIPDMVDQIGENMARLQSLMVEPAKKATDSTKAAFRGLASDVAGILDSLFPLQAQLRSVLEDIATLEKARKAGMVDAGTYGAARGKLEKKRGEIEGEINKPTMPEGVDIITTTTRSIEEMLGVLEGMPKLMSEAQIAFQEFGEELGNEIMGGLRDFLTGRKSAKDVLKDGIFRMLDNAMTSALSALEKSLFGEKGLGGFLGNLFGNVIKGLAVGGPALPGKAYTVGSGELFVPGQSGRVLSRNDAMRAAGGGGGGLGHISVTVSGARGNAEIKEMVREGVSQGIGAYDRVAGDRVDESFRRRGG